MLVYLLICEKRGNKEHALFDSRKGKEKWHGIKKGEEVRSINFKSPLFRFLLLKDLLKAMIVSALWRVVSDFFVLIIRCTAGVGFQKPEILCTFYCPGFLTCMHIVLCGYLKVHCI